MINVMILEDNKARRELLQLLIDSSDGMTCVGAYEDGRNIIQKVKNNLPGVILMDIDMPHVNGIDALKEIRAQDYEVKILMQTVFEQEDKIFEAILSGADGYLLKKTPPNKLLEAIIDVYEGGSPMTPIVARQVLQLVNNKHHQVRNTDFKLSERELEILSYLVQGLSYKMIASQCHISYSTVNTHISKIYEKLHVVSGPQAVAKAIEHKIV